MTVDVVAPLPVPSAADIAPLSPLMAFSDSDPSAEARKRRREILASQRNVENAPTPVVLTMEEMDSIISSASASMASAPLTKKRKAESSVATGCNKKVAKKPQMKYDPDVPMSKEEAAAWRREQRRKRNRESAAASRQRQRDRINELEDELEDWKKKYESIMLQVKKLEEISGSIAPPELVEGSDDILPIEITSRLSTSTPPPEETNTITPRSSPSVSAQFLLDSAEGEEFEALSSDVVEKKGSEGDLMLPSKMISRPAESRIIHPI